MVRLFTALVITLIGVTAHAHLSCFSLGFLAADGVSPEMVERTYFDLYDALAKDVGAESIRTLAEGGNPFHLPAGLGEKNPAFAKNVAEFEAMLDRLGWNTDAVRAPILDRLSGLAQRLQKSTKDRAHSVATQENIRRLKWREREDEPDPKLSADGHYFVTLLSGPEATGPASVAVYDLQTGRRQQQELPDSTTSSWTISSDGKSVVFAGGGYLDVYPLADGRLDVARRRRLGEADAKRPAPEIVAGQSPSQFFAYDAKERKVARYDVATGELIDIPISAINALKARRGSIKGWGRVPGTNDLWFAVTKGREFTLRHYGIDAKGDVVLRAPPRRLRTYNGNLPQYLPDGGFLVPAESLAFIASPSKKDQLTLFEPPKHAAEHPRFFIEAIESLPDGRIVAKTESVRYLKTLYFLDLYSAEGKHLAELELPEEATRRSHMLLVSADGRFAYVKLVGGGVISIPIARLEAEVKGE